MLSFFASLVITGSLVHAARTHGGFVLDHDTTGPQKFHFHPVPRVGGIGIFIGVLGGTLLLAWLHEEVGSMPWLLLICALPTFAAGLIEDLTKRVSARKRLLASGSAAALAFWLLGAQITRSDILGLDTLLTFSAGALAVTIVAVAGVANSINIIDGFNGLASMCVVIMLAALAYVAYEVGDPLVGPLSLMGIGAVLGFFLWNFPSGLIFLGDGGAYFLGFYVAELSILLLARNPSVSPLFPLLVCSYPVFETLFSIYRRRFLKQVPPSMPDGIHLHSLIHRRMLRWAVGDRSAKALTRRNSMTSPFLWLLCMLSVVPAVFFWNHSGILACSLLLFAMSYLVLYWRIVRFKSPRLMRLLVSQHGSFREGENRGS
jgi:UDP-N-acetylmuramyl pentapeptide phosphotransferase/UDP-N-acetylglucosamine-1-phosphate transferase